MTTELARLPAAAPRAQAAASEVSGAEATQASLLGYDGKWAIHPSQVPIALDVFTPSDAEVEEAQRIMADYRSAEARGVGAIGRGGKLVDAAMMRHAENVLRRVPERHV